MRSLVSAPLRGELTRVVLAAPTPAIDANLEAISGTLSRVVRLSSAARHQIPTIIVPDAQDEPHDAGAPWSWTSAEAATTHYALLSWLVHLAAAADDVDGLCHCLSTDGEQGEGNQNMIPGGLVNWLNPASGRSPLHVAAINGSAQCVHALLKAGSLVHLRDSLGHTALYYVSDFRPSTGIMRGKPDPCRQAARQGHDEIVSTLVSAGANLSGADFEGFAPLGVKMALLREDHAALDIWEKAGVPVPDRQQKSKEDVKS